MRDKIGFLQYQDIADMAMAFLDGFGMANDCPVRVDEIAELKMGMTITPLPNLQRDFDIVGFMSADFKTIYVDEYVFSNVEVRYLFTVAHELGHYVLHRDFLRQFKTDSITGWIHTLTNFDKQIHSNMEFQGNAFGGLLLVPQRQLKDKFHKEMPTVLPLIEQAKDANLKREQYLESAIEYIVPNIAGKFNVSADVVRRRIKADKLWRLIP